MEGALKQYNRGDETRRVDARKSHQLCVQAQATDYNVQNTEEEDC